MYNKEQLGLLVKRAKGFRTINQFSEDCGVSSAHLSRLIRGKLNSAPSVHILTLIANHSKNNVTFHELMVAAGYIDGRGEIIESPLKEKGRKCLIKERLKQAFVHHFLLSNHDVNWSIEPIEECFKEENMFSDLKVTYNYEHVIDTTYIEFLDVECAKELTEERFFAYLGFLSTLPTKRGQVFMFITSSEEVFEKLSYYAPLNISHSIRLILMDVNAQEVVGTTALTRHD